MSDYFPPDDPVPDAEALTVGCPLCGRPAGKCCVYMADAWSGSRLSYREGSIVHRKGTETAMVHNPRRRVFAEQRAARWRREHAAEAARLRKAYAVSQARRAPIVLALAEFDRREAEVLRAWLHDYGEILWAARPDGTARGGSYALGGRSHELCIGASGDVRQERLCGELSW